MKVHRKEENIAISVLLIAIGIMILYLILNNGSKWQGYFYYLNSTAATAGVLLTGYFIGNHIVRKKSGGLGIKHFAILAGAFCGFFVCLYVIWKIFDILWPEMVGFILLVAVWPILLYGLANWLDKHFSAEKTVLKLIIYILAVGAGIGWDIAVWSDNYSLTGGIIRPDYILYFLIIASVIGYRTFLKGTGKKSIRMISLVSIVVVIIGITAVIFYFNPRWHDIISYVTGDLTGQGTDVDWVGYRKATFRAYWVHDFDTLRELYPGEEYLFAMDTDGLIKLAYNYGAWTSVIFVLMETGVCAGLGILYTDIRKKGLLETPVWRIWNVVPYLILAYIIRTIFALTENMFMLSVWKMDLPFTGRSMIEILIPLILLSPWLYEYKEDLSQQPIFVGSALRKAAAFLTVFACISICFTLTQNTKKKLHEEALKEKWDYNDRAEEQANREAEEYLVEKTGKKFVVTGASKYVTEDTPEYAQWGISSDGVLYISGHGEVFNLGESYHKALEEKELACNVTRAIVMEGVESLGYEVFSDLPDLREVEIAESITRIEQNAFSKCNGLEKVVLHGYRTQIYPDAFYECSNSVRIIRDYGDREGTTFYRTKLLFEEDS